MASRFDFRRAVLPSDHFQLFIAYQVTILTQFMLPKSFGTHSVQEGSFSHFSSTKKRYSYLPGFRFTITCQIPFLSFFIELARVSQLLKSPARETLPASGAGNTNLIFSVGITPAIK